MLLIYRADYRRYGENLSISVAQDYQPILQSFRRMQWVGLGLGGAALLLILVAQRYTVRRALRPLEQVRQQIAQLQQGRRTDLDAEVPEELEPLVAQINHLLAHTEDTLKRSRNALGNLGHALKTPLAVLISLAGREELAAHPALRATMREQLEQIEQRLSRELGRARLAGEVLPGARFDCAQELPGLFATLSMIQDRGLSLDWQAPPTMATAAPSAAPLETPTKLGSASGLRNSPCIATPQSASTMPTVSPSKVRGVVGDQAEGLALDADQRGDQAGSELATQLQHAAVVGEQFDHLADVVHAQAVFRDHMAQLAGIAALPVAQRAIPAVLQGRDLMVAAQTGTGKTGGFALPILERLFPGGHPDRERRHGPKQPRVLVLTPTRELAAQVHDSFKVYARDLKFVSACIFSASRLAEPVSILARISFTSMRPEANTSPFR